MIRWREPVSMCRTNRPAPMPSGKSPASRFAWRGPRTWGRRASRFTFSTEAVDDVWAALEGAARDFAPIYVGWNVARGFAGRGRRYRLRARDQRRGVPAGGRLDEAVDYEKGCYLGQETVARIHYRGQVNRLLSGCARKCC